MYQARPGVLTERMSTSTVFISYRREDSGGWAGRLGDDLDGIAGADHVFRDVKIPPGVDYELHIERVLDACDVVLVVIGPHWATVADAAGQVRLQNPDDLLRKEIERGLSRPDVEVIPVLVQRAQMPEASTLPEGLRALTRRQAFELSDGRWVRDVDELAETLFGVRRPQPEIARSGGAAWTVAAAAAGVLLAGLITGQLAPQRATTEPEPQRLIVYAAERGVIWALAAALALAAASFAVRDDRVGAIGWAVIGAGFGAVAGALGGAALMLLKLAADLDPPLLHGVSTAVTGIVLGAGVARVMAGDHTAYRFAGLVGGLVGGIVAVLADRPGDGTSEGVAFLLIEATVLFGALAAVTIAVAPQALSIARGRAAAN